MQIKNELVSEIMVVHVQGRVDSLTALDFEKQVSHLLDLQPEPMVLDFERVEYISSAGLRSLLLIAKKANETNRQVGIYALNENILDIIRITGFLKFFKTFPDQNAAIAFYFAQ